MKKNIIVSLCLMMSLFISCSSGDSSTDSEEHLSSFIEPPLNFLITEEQFLIENGTPEFSYQGLLRYDPIYSGEKARSFDFYRNDLMDKYNLASVNFYHNEHNLEFMLNWLTDKYGEPTLEQDPTVSGAMFYYWENLTEPFYINLGFSTDFSREDGSLFVSYVSTANGW